MVFEKLNRDNKPIGDIDCRALTLPKILQLSDEVLAFLCDRLAHLKHYPTGKINTKTGKRVCFAQKFVDICKKLKTAMV